MSSKSHFFRHSGGLNLSLVAQYDFNNDLIDSVGGNNGTGTNITYNVGSFGNEAVFNGSSSFVEIADNEDFTFTDGVNDLPFRMELILKLDSNLIQYLIDKRQGSTTLFEWQLAYNNGSLSFVMGNENISSTIASSIFINPSSSIYRNIDIEYDGSKTQNGLRIYVDGIPNTLDPANPSYNGMDNTSSKVYIGKPGHRSDQYFKGVISQIKLYK